MPTTKSDKKELISSLKGKIQKAKIIVFGNFATLKVRELSALRKKVKEGRGEIVIAKKTLFQRALKEVFPHEPLDAKTLPGEIAFAFGYDDEISLPKVLAKALKEAKAFKILKGLWDGKVLSGEEIKTIAALPDRSVLISQLMSAMQAPIRNFEILLKVELIKFMQVVKNSKK